MFGEKLDPSCKVAHGPYDHSGFLTHHHPFVILTIWQYDLMLCDECIKVIAHLVQVLVVIGSKFTFTVHRLTYADTHSFMSH